jgi:hypothetical protein
MVGALLFTMKIVARCAINTPAICHYCFKFSQKSDDAPTLSIRSVMGLKRRGLSSSSAARNAARPNNRHSTIQPSRHCVFQINGTRLANAHERCAKRVGGEASASEIARLLDWCDYFFGVMYSKDQIRLFELQDNVGADPLAKPNIFAHPFP